MIEDWLKNFQNLNAADNTDERVIKDNSVPYDLKQLTPFSNINFCKFLSGIIDQYLLNQPLLDYDQKYLQLGLEVNMTIELLNIVCILNQEQFLMIFR